MVLYFTLSVVPDFLKAGFILDLVSCSKFRVNLMCLGLSLTKFKFSRRAPMFEVLSLNSLVEAP